MATPRRIARTPSSPTPSGATPRAACSPGAARRDGGDYGCWASCSCSRCPGRVEGPHHTFVLASGFRGQPRRYLQRRGFPDEPVDLPVAAHRDGSPPWRPPRGSSSSTFSSVPTLDSGVDWNAELPFFRKKVFDRLSRVGLDNLDSRVLAEAVLTPEDLRRPLQPHRRLGLRPRGHAAAVRPVPADHGSGVYTTSIMSAPALIPAAAFHGDALGPDGRGGGGGGLGTVASATPSTRPDASMETTWSGASSS